MIKPIYDSDTDPWLGTLEHFPTTLHGRASISHEMNETTLQKILVTVLCSLQDNSIRRKITVADESGYIDSNVMLKLGIGNRESFDVLDRKEMNRLLARIEQLGSFQMLDLIFNIHYNVSDKKKIRRVHGDEYFFRLTFHPGMFEILLHHRKGIRRIDSDEIIQLLLDKLNEELARNKYSLLEIQTIATS